MTATNKRYGLIWDPTTQRGEVVFELENAVRGRIEVSSAEEFNALVLMLKEQNVAWTGRVLWSDSGAARAPLENTLFDPRSLDLNPNARKIIGVCEDEWPANKGDCSGFVKDVAAAFGCTLTGQANDIVDQIRGAEWTQLPDGRAAKNAADEGMLVIGGLRGDEQQIPSQHGHAVVVVSGPLAKDTYPTAYWGTLGGTGERAKTINWAWKSVDRDNVIFGCRMI